MSPPRARGVAGSSALMFSGTLVSRLLGMVRDPLLVGAAIGINYGAANAFAVANRLPNMIYMLVAGGVLNAVLVPQIVRAIKQHDDGGQAYVNRLVTVAILGLGALTALLAAGSAVLVTIFARDLPPQWYDLAVTFGYWCIPQVFFYGMYTVLGQILNARGIFGPYMWAPALNNIVAIAGLGVYLGVFGGVNAVDPGDASVWTTHRTMLLAGTATLGVAAQALVLVVPLVRSGFRYRPRLDLRGSGLGRASKVATWVFAALAVGMISTVVISNVAARASRLGQGELDVAGNSAYNAAYLVYSLPTSLVVVSLITALFTRMAGNAATNDLGAVRADLSLALRTVGVFTVLASAVLMVLALPVVRVVAATVSYTEAQSIARVAVAMLAGLVGVGAFTVIQRVYYAFEDARALFFLQLPITAVVVVGALAAQLLPPRWTVVGIGVAMAVSNIGGAGLTYLGLRRHLRSIDGAHVLRTHLRLGMAAVPATALGWGLLHLLGTSGDELSVLGALWRTLVVGALMVAVYVALLRLLRVDELDVLARPVGRMVGKLGRRVPGPAGRLLVRAGAVLAPATARADDRDGPDDDGPAGPGGDAPGGPSGPEGGGLSGEGPAGAAAGDTGAADAGAAGAVVAAPDGGHLPGLAGTPPPAPRSPRWANVRGPADPLRTLGDDVRPAADHLAGEGSTALDAGKEHAGGTTREMLDDRYELGRSLSATVGGVERRRAHDTILARDVEALVLPAVGSGVAEVLDAARRAALVEDHRLVGVLDVGTDAGNAFVITDVVSGPDLAELTAGGPLAPDQARAVVGEATSAMESARRHGVRHLALRPDSVHVTPDGQVLVTGLGTDAVLLGTTEPDDSPLTATRRDATDLVRLLYLALTGRWPDPDDEVPVPPRALVPEVPGDLDALCARTFGGEGPRSTGELIRLLAPWPDVDAGTLPRVVDESSADSADDGAPSAGATTAAAGTNSDGTGEGTAAATAAGAAAGAGGAAAGAAAAAVGAVTRGPTPESGTPAPPPPPPPPAHTIPAWLRVRSADEAPAVEYPDETASTATDPLENLPESRPDAPAAVDDQAQSVSPTPAADPADAVGPAPAPAVDPADAVGPAPAPPPAAEAADRPEQATTAAGGTLAQDGADTGGIVTAPKPAWSPRRPDHPAEAPRFNDILDVEAPESTARHTRRPGTIAAIGALAGSAASSLGAGARRAADGTRTAAGAAQKGMSSAVVAGREKAADVTEARRARATENAAATSTGPAAPAGPPGDEDEDLLSAVDGPEVPFAERRINPTPVVLVAVGVLVLVLFLLSTRTLFAPPDPVTLPQSGPTTAVATEEATPETPAETTAPPEPTEPPPAPVIASLAPLDPQGDGGENPDLTPRALDGDPATFWRSRSYVNPEYGMKDGIGLAITLEQATTVSQVEIDLMGGGGLVQVRATSPQTPTEGEVLAEGEMGPGTVLTFAEPVETDSLVLWFPRLPVAASDGKNRIEMAELRVG